MYEAAANVAPRLVVILCEHPKIITVGRHGSRSRIQQTDDQLHREGLSVHWVNRDGGCLLHTPGQLAMYSVSSLDRCGWTAAEFRDVHRQGLQAALSALLISTDRCHGGLRGRTGLLAAAAMSLEDGVSRHESFINVAPAMAAFRSIDVSTGGPQLSGRRETMSCLLAERRLPVRMSEVRSALIVALTAAFRCECHHIHAGHPWLPAQGIERDSFARAS
jgi:lipoyl(octanoyl) transferase